MAKKVEIIKANNQINHDYRIRVGAYCRVSTDSEDQVNSFLSQMQYYTDYITNNPNMVFVDLYADEGITGTSINKRSEFKRMLKDCEKRRLDRILVKSVTRFARNSLECIESIRKMKECGVTVFFENDNIDTATMNSEMILYVKSAFAQSEAVSASKRMRLSIKMKMDEGNFKDTNVPFGYKLVNGKLVIIPDEAEKVKEVYRLYLSGKGGNYIAKYMAEKEHDGVIWSVPGIDYILTNERYIGDCMVGKSYKTDILPYKKVINRGEVDRYYYQNTNEPIISKDDFNCVQKIRLIKNRKYSSKQNGQGFFHGKIRCRHCGWRYKELWRAGHLYWCCAKKGYMDNKCHAPTYSNKDVENSFIRLFNTLKFNEKILLEEAIRQMQILKLKVNMSNPDIKKIDKKLLELHDKDKMYAQLFSRDIINSDTYMYKKNNIENEMDELKAQRKMMTPEREECKFEESLIQLATKIKKTEFLTKFDSELFNDMVDKILIEQTGEITYVLKGGIELCIK